MVKISTKFKHQRHYKLVSKKKLYQSVEGSDQVLLTKEVMDLRVYPFSP